MSANSERPFPAVSRRPSVSLVHIDVVTLPAMSLKTQRPPMCYVPAPCPCDAPAPPMPALVCQIAPQRRSGDTALSISGEGASERRRAREVTRPRGGGPGERSRPRGTPSALLNFWARHSV